MSFLDNKDNKLRKKNWQYKNSRNFNNDETNVNSNSNQNINKNSNSLNFNTNDMHHRNSNNFARKYQTKNNNRINNNNNNNNHNFDKEEESMDSTNISKMNNEEILPLDALQALEAGTKVKIRTKQNQEYIGWVYCSIPQSPPLCIIHHYNNTPQRTKNVYIIALPEIVECRKLIDGKQQSREITLNPIDEIKTNERVEKNLRERKQQMELINFSVDPSIQQLFDRLYRTTPQKCSWNRNNNSIVMNSTNIYIPEPYKNIKYDLLQNVRQETCNYIQKQIDSFWEQYQKEQMNNNNNNGCLENNQEISKDGNNNNNNNNSNNNNNNKKKKKKKKKKSNPSLGNILSTSQSSQSSQPQSLPIQSNATQSPNSSQSQINPLFNNNNNNNNNNTKEITNNNNSNINVHSSLSYPPNSNLNQVNNNNATNQNPSQTSNNNVANILNNNNIGNEYYNPAPRHQQQRNWNNNMSNNRPYRMRGGRGRGMNSFISYRGRGSQRGRGGYRPTSNNMSGAFRPHNNQNQSNSNSNMDNPPKQNSDVSKHDA